MRAPPRLSMCVHEAHRRVRVRACALAFLCAHPQQPSGGPDLLGPESDRTDAETDSDLVVLTRALALTEMIIALTRDAALSRTSL